MAEVISQLIDGNKKFRSHYFGADRTLFDDLIAHGQRPKIMIVACSDSRVDPAMIFNCQPGELFVVRNIANLIPPCENNDTYHGTSAALEFGIRFLQVEHLIVFGHTQCGGIQALLESSRDLAQSTTFISKWMELARPAYDKVMAQHADLSLQEKSIVCCQYALINSLKNLHTFGWIEERLRTKALTLHAWYFDLATGGLRRYDEEKNDWY